jgi:crossover junction endodeoxyribonuclease RuvC
MNHRPFRVLAADPGYERLGLAVLERTQKGGERVVTSLCLQTPKDLSLSERIGMLADQVRTVMQMHAPDSFAMERIFFNQSTSTALGVAEVRGMLETLAHEHGLPVYQYAPQQVKIAITGYSNQPGGMRSIVPWRYNLHWLSSDGKSPCIDTRPT